MASTLTAQSLNANGTFNWVFLVELLVCGILTLFFLFYFNRLLATLVSYGARTYTWHKFRVYVDIQSIQVSVLAGRVFFKGLRYHGKNETIFVQNGYITWRYWLRSVRHADLSRTKKQSRSSTLSSNGDAESEGSEHSPGDDNAGIENVPDLPCRIAVHIQGLEWFVYNRTPAYDAILSGTGQTVDSVKEADEIHDADTAKQTSRFKATFNRLRKHHVIDAEKRGVRKNTSSSGSSSHGMAKDEQDKYSRMEDRATSSPLQTTSTDATEPVPTLNDQGSTEPQFLKILPVWLECSKGAIVLGNENTRTIMITTFTKGSGRIDAGSSGPSDRYKQIFDFDIVHPVVMMRPNPDFKESQMASAERLVSGIGNAPERRRTWHLHLQYQERTRKIWHSLRDLVPYFQRSVESFHPAIAGKTARTPDSAAVPDGTRWLGLSRYLDEDERDDHEGWNAVEYARYSTILDCPSINFCFYWDVPGPVLGAATPPVAANLNPALARGNEDINGGDAPGYGLDLIVRGGTVNYGPWADRARVEIQNAFFPNAYHDAEPAKKLSPGAPRQSTIFKIRVDIEKETVLRVPTRENSKDWQWKGRADAVRGASKTQKPKGKRHSRKKSDKGQVGPDVRPFGWLSFQVAPDSTVTYEMDMFAFDAGYRNQLDLDLRGAKATSSVNHDLLWRCDRHVVSCDLSNPRGWNQLHNWKFNISNEFMEMFILRDHMFLLIDLVNDWSSGPPPEFYTFVPFQYNIHLEFSNVKLYLNANDSNIINNPTDLEDNTFIVIEGKKLASDLGIPIKNFRPNENAITFDANLEEFGLRLLTPLWNTQHTFMSEHPVASVKRVTLDGSYCYCLATTPSLTDTLFLDLWGLSPSIHLHGFLIRYFMTIKENYFGDDLHFRTMEEYQDLILRKDGPVNAPAAHPNTKSNELDVVLYVKAERASILLPANLYSRKDNVRLDVLSVESDMRFTSYYMDMEARFSPLEASLESITTEDMGAGGTISNTQLFIDGITINGHRLFGLPPSEPTYVCNWDFDVGRVIGECSTTFTRTLALGVRAFIFSLDDEENALPLFDPIKLHDVTFLRARVASVRLWLLLEHTALLLGTGPIDVRFDDWAQSKSSERLHMSLPDVTVAAVDRQSAARHRSRPYPPVVTHAYFQTSIDLRMVERKAGFAKERAHQQHHIQMHDQRTHRTPWLLHDQRPLTGSTRNRLQTKVSPPAMPYAPMPEPLGVSEGSMLVTEGDQQPHRALHKKSSFLSLRSTRSAHGRTRQPLRSKQSVPRASVTSPTRKVRRETQDDQYFKASRTRSKSPLHARSISPNKLPLDFERAQHGLPSSTVAYSSPWTPPYFALSKIEPDQAEMPLIPSDFMQRPPGEEQVNEISPIPEDDKAVHVSFLCSLTPGLSGFCSPVFLHAISSLVDELKPGHPIDVLDDLQMNVMTKILVLAKASKKPRVITDFSVRLTYVNLRLVNPYKLEQDSATFQEQDQYTLLVSQGRATGRLKTEKEENDPESGRRKAFMLHVAANEVSVAASEKAVDSHHDKAAVRGKLEDIVFWLASDRALTTKARVRNIEVATWSKKVERLASLIHRTTEMAGSVVEDFRSKEQYRVKLLRHLIYHLTLRGADINDPVFLTRTSYVLRAAGDHLRTNDSWKIIARLRFIYKSLAGLTKKKIIQQYQNGSAECPHDAEAHVLSSFDQWRAWDLAHVKKSFVMEEIWGFSNIEETTSHATVPTSSSISISSLRVVLQPGPKQTEFTIEDLSSCVALNVPMQIQSDGPEHFVSSTQTAAVQAYCSRIALRLNWEICELIEDTLKLFKTSGPWISQSEAVVNEASSSAASDIHVHVVFGTDLGTITLDSINMKVALISKGLRGSFIHEKAVADFSDSTTSLLLSSTSASSEIISHSRDLMVWRLWQPNIYGSLTSKLELDDDLKMWKLAGTCAKIHYEMKEDMVTVLGVMDRVVRDEVHYIHGLVTSLTIAGSEVEAAEASQKKPKHEFHVAMFLDDYRISVGILPALTYVISGEVARTTVMPRRDGRLGVDFDLKGHSHTLQSKSKHAPSGISILDVPPINGRVVIGQAPHYTTVEVDATIETVRLDAGALRSVLSTINRPEFTSALTNIKKQALLVKSHMDEMFVPAPVATPVKASERGDDLRYNARFTLAGVGIHASAPSIKNRGYSADLNFNVGLVEFHLGNSVKEDEPALEFPEFHMEIREIMLDLRRRHGRSSTPYGKVVFGACINGTSQLDDKGQLVRKYRLASKSLEVELFAETAFLVVDVAAYLQEKIKTLDLAHEVKQLRGLRRLTTGDLFVLPPADVQEKLQTDARECDNFFDAMYSLELLNIRVSWVIDGAHPISPSRELEDLVFSIQKIDFATKRENSARLGIDDLQLQLVPNSSDKALRSLNSALMPELIFNVAYLSTTDERRYAFQAAGKALDLRLTSEFILPATIVQKSVASASKELREANAFWAATPVQDKGHSRTLFSSKRLASFLVDADFAGAVVNLQGRRVNSRRSRFSISEARPRPEAGRYGQFIQGDSSSNATLRAPGVALKFEYKDSGTADPSLNAEIKVAASTNVLYPTVVPLILEISSSIKEAVGDSDTDHVAAETKAPAQSHKQNNPLESTDPSAILGRTKLNVGLWICKQEFSLSCQPVARVAATARFDDIFMTVNTVQSTEQTRFFALLLAFNNLQASVQHVYSRESTAKLDVNSIVVSLMNSKHVSAQKGISAILKVSPMRTSVNVKQLQDFLLFREIWYPEEIRQAPAAPAPTTTAESQAFTVQRYQQVAAAGAFPWNATVSLAKLDVQVDLGQGLGKSSFSISNLWVSSNKSSDLEQNLCLGFEKIGIDSTGRMSGFVELQNFRIRTSIQWPPIEKALAQTPLVQASLGFDGLRVKAAFDYQAFLIADISEFEFLMYNVKEGQQSQRDRLVAILDGGKIQVFCTTASASQGLALFQAVQRLVQEKQAAYQASLKEVEKFLRRKSVFPSGSYNGSVMEKTEKDDMSKLPISLHTDVVMTLRAVSIGAFPSTFFDNQIFKIEATDAQARFAVAVEDQRTHSGLGLTLGQLRVALSAVNRPNTQALGEVSVDDVVTRATGSPGGTILKVPKVIASMQTWQTASSNRIDYIFKSDFQGKVDVGWNYSRISFIRGMWVTHSRALAHRLGKPLPQSAVQITGGPLAAQQSSDDDQAGAAEAQRRDGEQEKITAVVNVPQSRYEYTALEPPIIDTPQLRAMGEATPPLEWIGLHRDRLPHVTHQIIIVTLLEVAKEVEDAYARILGSS